MRSKKYLEKMCAECNDLEVLREALIGAMDLMPDEPPEEFGLYWAQKKGLGMWDVVQVIHPGKMVRTLGSEELLERSEFTRWGEMLEEPK